MTGESATHSVQRNAKTLKTKQRAHSTPLKFTSLQVTSLYFTPSHLTSPHFLVDVSRDAFPTAVFFVSTVFHVVTISHVLLLSLLSLLFT